CCRFCKLRSRFVKLPYKSPGRCGPVHISANHSRDVLFIPPHDLCNGALRYTGNVKARGRRSAQVVKVQVAVGETRSNLRFIERTAKAVSRPWAVMAISQNCGRSPRDRS